MRLSFAVPIIALAGLACADGRPSPLSAPSHLPTVLAITAGNAQASMVNAAVPIPPTVIVKDRAGRPVAGVNVDFEVTRGGGSVASSSVVSDTNGYAIANGWVLGTIAGTNTLQATLNSKTFVAFTATGIPGPPARVQKLQGDAQSAMVNSPLADAPAIIVWDAYGNPVPNVSVVFSVTSGGGSIGRSPVGTISSLTASDGKSTAEQWTVGANAGANTLDVTADTLPPVTFTATAVSCADPPAWTIGTPLDGKVTSAGCRLPGIDYSDVVEFADQYKVTTSGTSSLQFAMTADSHVPHIRLLDSTGEVVGSTSYFAGYYIPAEPLRVLIPAGAYTVGASLAEIDYSDLPYGSVAGTYALSSGAVGEDVSNCDRVFVAPGITTNQRIGSTDCSGDAGGARYYFDVFGIRLRTGVTYTISMSSTDFDTYLDLTLLSPTFTDAQLRPSQPVWNISSIAANDDAAGTNSQVTFTPLVAGVYAIRARTVKPGATGAYTLTIQQTAGSVQAGFRLRP